MNNTLDKCVAERRSAQKLWAANRRAKERKAKEQQEEEALERECLSFPHLYQGPDSDEDKDRRKARHKEIIKNIKDERKILEEERALEDKCRSKFPHIPLYHHYEIRPFGENREERKVRRRRIRRRMAAAANHQNNAMVAGPAPPSVAHQSNAMVVDGDGAKPAGVAEPPEDGKPDGGRAPTNDQVVEEAMGQPGQFEGRLLISTVSVAAFNNQLRVDNAVAVVPPLMDPYARQKWKCPDCGEHGWLLQVTPLPTNKCLNPCPWCGAVFLGHYVEEKFEVCTGQYFIIYPDGAVYWGYFVEGKFDGEGIFMFPANNCDDLVMYNGSWKAGQKEGHGKLVWDDRAEYVGDFKDGECHGQGKITMPSDDQLEYEYVLWNNLQDMEQPGVHWTIDYTSDELKADLSKWLRNQIPPNGDTYKGQWKYGQREGVHVKTSSEGQLLAIEKYVDDEIVCSEVRPTGYCEEGN